MTADKINLTELREAAKRQDIYRQDEELHDWPVEAVLALLDAIEAARDYITVLDNSGSATTDYLEEALDRFTP